ncbi:hypothetical protein HYW21_01840 [Candidatus Woesearchaeota archaeon]|nr:hypothetical protein [Candidatus Woesearchaeota archaeon]
MTREKTIEQLETLRAVLRFDPAETTYWQNMEAQRNTQVRKGNYQGRINFYLNELQTTQGKFGERVGVEVSLRYLIGHAYEWLGTYGLEGHEPQERAEMLATAVLWYQSVDKSLGFHSGCAGRQIESCWGAARFRTDAGLEDQVTEAFCERGAVLLRHVLGLVESSANLVAIDGTLGEYLKQMADAKMDSVTKAYLFK